MKRAMWRSGLAVAVLGLMAGATTTRAKAAIFLQLGEQDFTDGQFLTGSAGQFNDASAGEVGPFNAVRGGDGSSNFSATFTFAPTPLTAIDAMLTLGIADNDAATAGDQVQSFTLDGFDLTSLLNVAFEAKGGLHLQYSIYTITLPTAALAGLADGSATFSLTLQGPTGAGSSGNGAGLDFARLSLDTGVVAIPEPSSMALIGTGAGLCLGYGWRKRRKAAGA